MRANGRAQVSARHPRAFAICDGCGGLWNHDQLAFQYKMAGVAAVPTARLVCRKCTDRLNPNLRTIRIDPDPAPVFDPRPQFYSGYSGDGRRTDGPIRLVYADGADRLYDPTLPSGVHHRANPDFDAVDPDESEIFAFDFSRFVGAMPIDYALWSVETISGDDQSPNEKVLGMISITSPIVSHRMGGFTSGCIYRVTCTAMTPTGDGYTVYSQFSCNSLK